MATAHINAYKEDIAPNVLMPGDPLRAKYIANKYLQDVKLINTVRGMAAFTGTFEDKPVTIFPSGMGIGSAGIYSYELFNEYGVNNIIRIGTCGSYSSDIHVSDVVLAKKSYSSCSYAKEMLNIGRNYISSSPVLNSKILKEDPTIKFVNVHTTDAFYGKQNDEFITNNNLSVCEMESYAILANAQKLGKNATAMFTCSNSLSNPNERELTSLERQTKLDKMILIALKALLS